MDWLIEIGISAKQKKHPVPGIDYNIQEITKSGVVIPRYIKMLYCTNYSVRNLDSEASVEIEDVDVEDCIGAWFEQAV